MREYAKVSPQFWINPLGRKIKSAGTTAQVLGLYLLTNPHATMLGVYYLPLATIAHETGLTVTAANQGLHTLCELDFCSYDEASEYVWIHEMAADQIGLLKENDNRVKAINKTYLALPHPLRTAFYRRYKDVFFLTQAPLKPLRSKEKEQEKEKEKDIYMSGKFQAYAPSKPLPAKKRLRSQAIDVLHFLNEKTGRVYRAVHANLHLISARLASGTTKKQCYQVIAKKTREWKEDPKMNHYLRPATLFHPMKFEQYVGELVAPGETDEH